MSTNDIPEHILKPHIRRIHPIPGHDQGGRPIVQLRDPFMLATNGAFDKLASLIDGGSVSPSAVQTKGMFSGQTLLHLAAGKGHTPCVQMLLQKGADPAQADHKGRRALELAAAQRRSQRGARRRHGQSRTAMLLSTDDA